MLATDHNLLALEPTLFNEIRWAAQTLLDNAPGVLAPSGLSLTVTDIDLTSRAIRPGHVAILDGLSVEIIDVALPATLLISRPRASSADPPIPVLRKTLPIASITISTFAPQIGIVHEQLLRAIGIEPDAPDVPGAVTTDSITNPGALARVEALGALHLIFAAASAMVGEQSILAHKAAMYRERFAQDRRRLAVAIDLDGDGVAEAVRRPNIFQLTRS